MDPAQKWIIAITALGMSAICGIYYAQTRRQDAISQASLDDLAAKRPSIPNIDFSERPGSADAVPVEVIEVTED